MLNQHRDWLFNMNVKTLCLAILHDKDASGYEIRKLSTEGDYSFFVEASFGAIYPALARLEAEGLVTSHVEAQESRPAKKVYSITAAGRESFRNSLFEDLGEDTYRSEFLLFARFAAILPASLVETRIREKLAEMDRELERFEQIKTECGECPADLWLVNYGIEVHQVARRYLADHMHELIALAQPDAKIADAAE